MRNLITALFVSSAVLFLTAASLSAAETKEEAVNSYVENAVNTMAKQFPIDDNTKSSLKKIVSEYTQKMLVAANEPARNEWIAFQGSKEFNEINDMVNKEGLAKIAEAKSKTAKAMPLFSKEMVENKAVAKAYAEMQKQMTAAFMSSFTKGKATVPAQK